MTDKNYFAKEKGQCEGYGGGNNVTAVRYSIRVHPFCQEWLTREKAMETMESIVRNWSVGSWKHHQRTRVFTQLLLEHLCIKPEFSYELGGSVCEAIINAAYLHDIGEIGIPHKPWPPAQMTPDEIAEIHTAVCGEIIGAWVDQEDALYYQVLNEVCRHHHEHWNGRGYPDGLTGTVIPLSARIVAVADMYDTISFRHVNKKPFSHEKAAAYIKWHAGRQFDPDIVAAFCEIEDRIRCTGKTLARRHPDRIYSEKLAVTS